MSIKSSLSIGIPAYNEAKKIKSVLQSLLDQTETGFTLKEIIVISDGSSDDTQKKVNEINDTRIKFVDGKSRMGKSARMDQLFRTFSGDMLILVDADVAINDQNLLKKVVEKAKLSKSGLAAINALPLHGVTSIEHALESGVMIMKDTAKHWRNGNNYLSFKGCFLALDKSFAQNVHMPASVVNNDAFMYFSAVEKGYSPEYLDSCVIYYRSPKTLADHLKQSTRFQTSQNEMQKHFNRDLTSEFTIPKHILALSTIKTLLKNPIYTMIYLGVNVVSKLKKPTNIKSTWSIARSTK